VCVCVCVCVCVSQRLDVCHINYNFNSRSSENYGNNINGIRELKFFLRSFKLLITGNLFLFLPFPIFPKILNVRCVNPNLFL
jgi:hypothetical protein